jgi:hypothetical protein
MNKLKEFSLRLNYFEFGVLFASIPSDIWENMPRNLWLKLHIHATKAYLKHPNFSRTAKKDIDRWKNELNNIK